MKAANELIKSDEKINQLDAKCIITEGEKLGFTCNELKQLRNALKAARGWANRVKKCNIEHGGAQTNLVQELIDEHDKLLIEMPEELENLKSAMTSYCVCRRPYSGFMIGCDECEEWYHGHCIGITESRADKVDKYVCVRCCCVRTYKSSAAAATGIIRKWTTKERKKFRQIEAQKHQRKVRKETKEIEKLREEIEATKVALDVMKENPVMDDKMLVEAPCENSGAMDESAAVSSSAAVPSENEEQSKTAGEQPPVKVEKRMTNEEGENTK